jgi:hypothetical protein
MSETKSGEIDRDQGSPLAAKELQGKSPQSPDTGRENVAGVGADREPMVTDPGRASESEETGGWGTGTPGSSTVAGLQDVAPIESAVTEKDEGQEQVRVEHDDERDGGIDG